MIPVVLWFHIGYFLSWIGVFQNRVISLRNFSGKVDVSTIRGKTGVITTYKNVVKTTENYKVKWL